MYNINSEKGATEWQLIVIVSIILGFLLLILGWMFTEKLSDLSISAFIKMNTEVKKKVCESFGIFGQTIGKLFGC